jgi:hypothetical protein
MKNINLKEVQQAIISGMIKGYNENQLLTTNYRDFQNTIPEYLLTVNVAQNLIKWNEHYKYKINIEYPFSNYLNNAFKGYSIIYENNDVFNQTHILRKTHESDRSIEKKKRLEEKKKIEENSEQGNIKKKKEENSEKGNVEKIDIAITIDVSDNIRSLIGIELKGINTSTQGINDDIKRLKQAINEIDEVSENSILAGYSCFIQKLSVGKKDEEILTKNQIDLMVNKFKDKWQIKVNTMTQVELIEVFIIEATALEDIENIHRQRNSDYHEVASETGVVVGTLLKVFRA